MYARPRYSREREIVKYYDECIRTYYSTDRKTIASEFRILLRPSYNPPRYDDRIICNYYDAEIVRNAAFNIGLLTTFRGHKPRKVNFNTTVEFEPRKFVSETAKLRLQWFECMCTRRAPWNNYCKTFDVIFFFLFLTVRRKNEDARCYALYSCCNVRVLLWTSAKSVVFT